MKLTEYERMRQAMNVAIQSAKEGAARGERPFGCVIVGPDGLILTRTWGSETPTDPTCHSEVVAIQLACKRMGGLLQGCTLFSTHEPCAMCCGAIVHSKISHVVWGSSRADFPQLFRQRNYGAVALLSDTTHPPNLDYGVCADECRALFENELKKLETRLVG